jgi:hypothetical protein
VEQFLHTLEPAISSAKVNIQSDMRKRGAGVESSAQPPKRRAFGLDPPKQLFIDVSDDDSEEEEADTEHKVVEPVPQRQPMGRIVKIPKIADRPPVNQKVQSITAVLILGY